MSPQCGHTHSMISPFKGWYNFTLSLCPSPFCPCTSTNAVFVHTLLTSYKLSLVLRFPPYYLPPVSQLGWVLWSAAPKSTWLNGQRHTPKHLRHVTPNHPRNTPPITMGFWRHPFSYVTTFTGSRKPQVPGADWDVKRHLKNTQYVISNHP